MQIIALWQDAELICMAHTIILVYTYSRKVQRLGAPALHYLSCVGVNFMTSQYVSVCTCEYQVCVYVPWKRHQKEELPWQPSDASLLMWVYLEW